MWSGWERREARKDETERISLAGSPKMPDRARDDSQKPERERLGLGKGKVYSNEDCACYIERRFASLCVTASGEPLSHSTLRNLTVTSNSDQIHCDIQGADGLLFHIPSQLGSSC